MSKKQKINEHVEVEKDDQEEAEMKRDIEIVKDDEVAINAIPLATKPLIQKMNIKFRGGLLGLKDFKMILRVTTAQIYQEGINMKDAKFDFLDECIKSFNILKDKVVTAPVIIAPNWDSDFELMCDTNDYAIGAVIGQLKSLTSRGLISWDPFPPEEKKYILVAVDYVSKWVEAEALPTNDARVVVRFLKKLFSRFGVLKALISYRGKHFCNSLLEKTLKKYGVTHRIATPYHPQTSGETENTNRAIKRILERTFNGNRKERADKLDDAL
ncbi:reverse transcriptase domain-containing protein [Tanacetum coccineum]